MPGSAQTRTGIRSVSTTPKRPPGEIGEDRSRVQAKHMPEGFYSAVQRVNETSSAGDRLIASTKIQAKQ